ncbi:superoxide dismutase family protein [Jeongeupia chitinilytica]|uniref:Superoxide dismutase [Cu-Zn] n=1 Tax=Jeongeupia chitinilytica TaxID=1041641 RepID=A0ABQ3H5S2_9NEIS|nr:superoxide dismutase family protein [Jeongeupia chitinilytica]GHD68654.1 superoxide dismutase [Cu-Zn] [Jeongeupia chitinilytica]
MRATLMLTGLAVLATACSMMPQTPQKAQATLLPTSGQTATGKVGFRQSGDTLLLDVTLSGLTPGQHGFHVHEKGDCSAPDASSAGGHFNPDKHQHGSPDAPDHHAGDLGNVVAGADGRVSTSITVRGVQLDTLRGRALVVHAGADDLKSQPAGNSGARIACGVIN